MRVIRILPEMNDSRFLTMFHEGISGQWPPSELPWEALAGETAELRREVALWAAPFACEGERAIRLTSRLIPRLSLERETEAQLYLITLQLDKARQFHVFEKAGGGGADGEGRRTASTAPASFAPYALSDQDGRSLGKHSVPQQAKARKPPRLVQAPKSAAGGAPPVSSAAHMWELYCVTELSRALLGALRRAIRSEWFDEAASRVLADQTRQLPFLASYAATARSLEQLAADPDAWTGALAHSAETFRALLEPSLPFARSAARLGVALERVIEEAVHKMELRLDDLLAQCAGDADQEAQFV